MSGKAVRETPNVLDEKPVGRGSVEVVDDLGVVGWADVPIQGLRPAMSAAHLTEMWLLERVTVDP